MVLWGHHSHYWKHQLNRKILNVGNLKLHEIIYACFKPTFVLKHMQSVVYNNNNKNILDS